MKKFVCILLTLAMLFTLVPVSVLADTEYETVNGTVMYNAGHDDMENDHPCPFIYSDGYFTDTAYNYRQELATVTMAMAMGAGNVSEPARFAEGPANLMDFFAQIGFEDFECNKDFVTRPYRNTFGVGIANKEIVVDGEKYTVIAIGLRGCGYYSEWAGDFNLGESGDHAGFVICRDTALDFLQEYLAAHTEIEGKIKLWCTGYSRGAVGANMLGGYIDDMLLAGKQLNDRVTLTLDDVYIYTFESPMGAMKEKTQSNIYNNIHNVINYNDLVVKVPPECLNFARYGVDHVMPCYGLDDDYDALQAKMLEAYATFENGGDYIIDDFKYVTVTPAGTAENIRLAMSGSRMSQGEFVDRVVDILFGEVLGSRSAIYEKQSMIQEVIQPFIGAYPDQMDAVKQNLADNACENLKEIMFNLLKADRENSVTLITNIILKSFSDAGICDLDAESLFEAIPGVVDILIDLVVKHPDEVATLIFNITNIMSAHYGEVGMAWMMTVPDDYMLNKQTELAMPFDDVSADAWYVSELKAAYDKGLINGTAPNIFDPKGEVTRGQVVTVLYRMAGAPSVSDIDCPFKDAKGAWCEDAIVWAYNEGIAKGLGDDFFGADIPVTREQLTAFIFRYAGVDYEGNAAEVFPDYGEISDYAKPAMSWAYENGILLGMGDGSLAPQGTADRAQLVCVIARFAA